MILFFIFVWALFSGHPLVAFWLVVHGLNTSDGRKKL